MRIGLSTPVVVQIPGIASPWEATASPDDLAEIASTADRVGMEFLTCSEHVAVPSADAGSRGLTYWDPLSTLGFLAAHTRRIQLVTAVLVLGYHHPLEIAKRYGTLDRVSGGRVVLGVGIGSLEAEFALIGASWERRATRADDALAALRAALGHREPVYEGPFYRFAQMTVDPHAVQPKMPIWVGGRSAASLRRAVQLADGWMPFGLSTATIAAMLSETTRPAGFDVVLGTSVPVDPSADPVGTRNQLSQLGEAGATIVSCSISARSAEHYCDQLHRLAEIAATVKGDPQ